MNEINIRFKEMRKKLNLSQIQLGNSLGLSSSGISNIENGTRNVTDKHIKLLVATFNINEEWLKNGTGAMQLPTDASILEELVNEYHMTDKQKRILSAFVNMDDTKREVIAEAFFAFIDSLTATPETAATVLPIRQNESKLNPNALNDTEIEEELADYRKELEAEQKGQLALQNLGGKRKA